MAHNILLILTVCVITFVIEEIVATRNIGFIGTKGKRESKESDTETVSPQLGVTIPPLPIEATNEIIENETNGISTGNNELYLNHLPDRSIFKRTPSGFIGSRGKKDFEYSDINGGNLNLDEYEPGFIEHNAAWFNSLQNSKRTPTGFVGMRGKKKPASGFYGVRGKKDSTPNLDDLYEQLENMFEDYEDYHPNEQLYSTVEYLDPEKRANRNGFVGVRGRRYPYGLVPHLEEYVKRVPNGFMGMRGRRFDDSDIFEQAEKRKTNNAFFGVRGKKDVSKQLSQFNDIDKRTPFASYFGVKGEKRLFNSNGFFGTRGKKQPYEFRGKFVGVRGKKSMTDNNESDMSFNSNSIDTEMDKRTPNGFMGMRG